MKPPPSHRRHGRRRPDRLQFAVSHRGRRHAWQRSAYFSAIARHTPVVAFAQGNGNGIGGLRISATGRRSRH